METVLVENVLVVTVLVEPVSLGNVGREPLPVEVKDPTPLGSELGSDRVTALLPPESELTGLSDDRLEKPEAPEDGREPDNEPDDTGNTELLGGGAPYVGIVTEDAEADTGGGRLLVPIADEEAEDPVEDWSDEPGIPLELPPGGVTELEADETDPDVSGAEEDKLAEFDALDSWEDEEPAMELDGDMEIVTEFEALPRPLEALPGPFELPYPVDADTLTEADAVPWVEDTEPDGPEEPEEDGTTLLLDAVSELSTEELPPPAEEEEAELSVRELDKAALPEDEEAEITLLSTLDCELGSRLEPPVTDAELPVAETDELVPGLVLRLGRLSDPEREADPEAETGDVPLVAGGKVPLLIETVGMVSVAELPVLLLTGLEDSEATLELELRLVAGGTVPGFVLMDGPVADDGGFDDWDEGTPDIEDEDSPTEEDEGVPEGEGEDCSDDMELPVGTIEDEGPYGPAVLLVVSNRDEGTPLSVVPPYGELDWTGMVTTELEAPEDGTERVFDAEGLETEAEPGGGKITDIVVVLGPLEMPGFDETGMLLRAADEELPKAVDELGLSLITVDDGLTVSVSALVVVRVVIREVNSFVVMVAMELLLIVVSKVDGGVPLLDSEDDTTAEFEDELRV
ncbi:hypothetical protein VMCG_09389 [Cytospora schulzeri]|uniref:Uncharacterized protein n=1 Tax=Cytospora schulzeri TaxID=448051 RepID=A0A423VIG5_9PEZI|nr:hypothetical protein VMCG_09389 [Valsa malicola]